MDLVDDPESETGLLWGQYSGQTTHPSMGRSLRGHDAWRSTGFGNLPLLAWPGRKLSLVSVGLIALGLVLQRC